MADEITVRVDDPVRLRSGRTTSVRLIGALSPDQALAERLKKDTRARIKALADKDPQGFGNILGQIYGKKIDDAQRATLTEKAQAGAWPVPETVRFLDAESMRGRSAAYAKAAGGLPS